MKRKVPANNNPGHFQERRKHPRIEKKLPLRLIDPSFNIATETKNISCSGAYCKVNQYIAPLTKLNILLVIPTLEKNKKVEQRVECSGVVVRTESSADNSYNIAIFFNRIEKEDSQKIADYVEWYLKGKNN